MIEIRLSDNERGPQYFPDTFTDLGAAGANVNTIATVWTPASGKTIRVLGGTISSSAAVAILFEDNSAHANNFVFRTPVLEIGVPFTFTLGKNGKKLAAADRVLKATGAGATITGTLYGVES